MHNIQKKKTDQGGDGYTLTLDRITRGEIIAITRALRFYNSPVSKDVLAYINLAIHDSGLEDVQNDVKESLVQLEKKMEERLTKV